jgi:threonine/homoserine/homoserine lactone efflux protein
MTEEYEKQRRKQVNSMRSIMDYTMGIIFFGLGMYFLLYEKLGMNFLNRKPSTIDYLIGGLFVLYGGWRIYRGYKKNYFVE